MKHSHCRYCGLDVNPFSANPSKWPLGLSFANGVVETCCVGCVTTRLIDADRLRAELAKSNAERDEAIRKLDEARRETCIQARIEGLEREVEELKQANWQRLTDAEKDRSIRMG